MTQFLLALTAISTLQNSALAAEDSMPFFNTVKQKLAEGKQVIGGTVDTADPEIYCAMANAGFDFIWIEMQHSHLNYTDVARSTAGITDALPMTTS